MRNPKGHLAHPCRTTARPTRNRMAPGQWLLGIRGSGGMGRVVALTMSDHPICARCVIFISPYCSIGLRHMLSLSAPMATSDPGIPPAPPDTAGHVGEVPLGGCPGSGMREVGLPHEFRGHVGQALALGSRQRTGDWECGGRYGSCGHGASGIIVARCRRHLPRTSAVTMPP